MDFLPRLAGEHRIAVVYRQTPVTGSPFLTKVYDVRAIKVKHVARGVIGKPVTFIGKYETKLIFIYSNNSIHIFGRVICNTSFYKIYVL